MVVSTRSTQKSLSSAGGRLRSRWANAIQRPVARDRWCLSEGIRTVPRCVSGIAVNRVIPESTEASVFEHAIAIGITINNR